VDLVVGPNDEVVVYPAGFVVSFDHLATGLSASGQGIRCRLVGSRERGDVPDDSIKDELVIISGLSHRLEGSVRCQSLSWHGLRSSEISAGVTFACMESSRMAGTRTLRRSLVDYTSPSGPSQYPDDLAYQLPLVGHLHVKRFTWSG
jgi:hypothetical protein